MRDIEEELGYNFKNPSLIEGQNISNRALMTPTNSTGRNQSPYPRSFNISRGNIRKVLTTEPAMDFPDLHNNTIDGDYVNISRMSPMNYSTTNKDRKKSTNIMR